MGVIVDLESRDGGVRIVRIAGSLDASAVADLEQVLLPAAEDAAVDRVILDCAALDYVASAGLRVFLKAVKAMLPRKGKLFAVAPQPPVASAMKMAGFHSFIAMKDSIDECLD